MSIELIEWNLVLYTAAEREPLSKTFGIESRQDVTGVAGIADAIWQRYKG